MKLNIIAALMLFSLTTSSYAFDSDDEEAFLFPKKPNNEQAKKRSYSSQEHAPNKKIKIDSAEEIKEILSYYSFNTIADLKKIITTENFFDIAESLLQDHEYNEQTADILCLTIKENSISADLRLKAATILAKSNGSSFLDNIPFKIKGLQACNSILHLHERWLIHFFNLNPYHETDYKNLTLLQEDFNIKIINEINPNNELNWSNIDYKKIIHALALINPDNYESFIQPIQKKFSNDWSGDNYFQFIHKSIAMIEFGAFNCPPHFHYDIIQELYSIHSEKLDYLICFIKILSEPFWTPHHYIETIKTFSSIPINEFLLIAQATKKIAQAFWSPDHYTAVIKTFNNVNAYTKTITWVPNYYQEVINPYENILNISNLKYLIEAIIHLKHKVIYFTSQQFVDVIRGLDKVGVAYAKKVVEAVLSISLNDWTSAHFAEAIKAFSHFPKLNELEHINETALAVKTFAAHGRNPAFYASLINEFINLKPEHIPTIIDAVQKLSLPIWTPEHYHKIIRELCMIVKNYNNPLLDKNFYLINNMINNYVSILQKLTSKNESPALKFMSNDWLSAVFNFVCYVPEKYRIDLMNYFAHHFVDNSVDRYVVFINYLKSIPENDWGSILTYFDEYNIQSLVDNLINNNINMAEYLLFSIIENSTSGGLKFYALKLIFCHPDLKEKNQDKKKQYLLDIIQNGSEEDCIKIIHALTICNNVFDEKKEMLKELFKKTTYDDVGLIKIRGYILFGEFFREEYDQLIKSDSFINLLDENLDDLFDEYGQTNPRIQELLILYSKAHPNENSDNPDAIDIYANLLLKLNENYKHNPSRFSIRLNENQDKMLHFTINQKALSYLLLNQEALANLEDVDFILGDNPDETLKSVRDSDDFKHYFTAPFSEESMMIQAMVKKFKNMGEAGLKKLAHLMHDMNQCFQGKNQAIWDHYLIESKPLCMAELKNITTWLLRLQTTKEPYITDADLQSSYKMSRQQLATLILNMLKNDHICRRHFTDIHTDDAQRLKALLGTIVEFEGNSNDHVFLGKTLKQALDILIKLSNPEEFYKNLDNLCKTHEIYLPANKFGDQLSAASIKNLIQQLNEKDVEGRDDLLKAQEKLRLFTNRQDFLNLLSDFKDEPGQKLRMLLNGYIENNWSIGLLNLMELAEDNNLNEAIEETFNNTKIDKDMNLTWLSLEKIFLRELVSIKRQIMNAIAENLVGKNYAEIPHDIKYLEGLIGGITGLRDPKKAPNFDAHGNEVSYDVTSRSLQTILDLFHEKFTPDIIIDYLTSMINENKLSIIDPKTGVNIIGQILGIAAKEQLKSKGITEDECDLDLLLLDDQKKKEAMRLSLALLLEKLGILKETNEDNTIIINNDIITD